MDFYFYQHFEWLNIYSLKENKKLNKFENIKII